MNEGSSLGVKIVKDLNELIKSVKNLSNTYDQLIEQFIGGQEIQAAETNNIGLGAIELIPKDLFTITTKYKSAKTKHIMPARLSKNNYTKVLKLATSA